MSSPSGAAGTATGCEGCPVGGPSGPSGTGRGRSPRTPCSSYGPWIPRSPREVGGRVAGHQVAAGGQSVEKPRDQFVRAVLVRNEVQQGHERQRDGAVEVQDLPRALHDGVRVTEVGPQVLRHGVVRAPEQIRRVGEDDRVVVAVDDVRAGRDLLGDLMEVGLRGYATADVQELADALAGQPVRGSVHEGPVDPGHDRNSGIEGQHLPAHRLVYRVVVSAAEVPVVHPGGVGFAGVDLNHCLSMPMSQQPRHDSRKSASPALAPSMKAVISSLV